jgi:Tol biopolymer transport system component/tRNA A-37 threonylcarbamoyl transferase component Bud32
LVGQTLGHYRILARIGSGGMGEVYLAEDATLGRRVALKVLPRELNSDERRGRLEREARALAALNHPNIVTIYSVESEAGAPFITMELLDGATLADLVPAEGLALDRFFAIAVPIADAVAAAHQHGIVHRDLKPGNVMVTTDGRVKVLDFGLAKTTASGLESAARDDPTAPMTDKGVIVGTWRYMSPEQARGLPVDARSDIFALGVVFYEMLTGRRPFTGDTPTELLSSIIKDTPQSVSAIRSGLPRELARLVRRCLAKDPARRVQSALDIRNELDDLKREMDSGELVAEPRIAAASVSTRTAPWRIGVALALAAVAVGLGGWRWLTTREAPVMHLRNPRQVTFTSSVETDPTWSPDGGRIAFVSDRSGNQDIWVTAAAGGPAVNLTADDPAPNYEPAWSPDGNQIAFLSEGESGGVYVMPAIGGRPIRLSARGSAEVVTNPQWSADGRELAHMRREEQSNFIEVVSLSTRESRRLPVPGEPGNRWDLSWSPDGRFFAYVRAPNPQEELNRLWVLHAANGEAFPISDGTTGEWSPIWSADGSVLYFLSNRGGSVDLWQQRIAASGLPDGDARAVTVGIGMRQVALTRDGRKLAYSKGRPVANVWRVPILADREAGWGDAEQITFDEAFVRTLELHPDGRQLIIASDRGGSEDLWVAPLAGTDMRQLTAVRGSDGGPQVSPDGRQIAFYSLRSGSSDIWVMPLEGGPAVQLTRDPGFESFPSWSPDGRRVAFYGLRDGSVNAFVVQSTGGDVRPLTTGAVSKYFPQWLDPQSFLFASDGPDRNKHLFRVTEGRAAPEQVTRNPAYYFRTSPDATRIYFSGDARGSNDLWMLTLSDGRERRLAQFSRDHGEIGELALAASNTHLYFTMRKDVGDIWVMDVAPDREP